MQVVNLYWETWSAAFERRLPTGGDVVVGPRRIDRAHLRIAPRARAQVADAVSTLYTFGGGSLAHRAEGAAGALVTALGAGGATKVYRRDATRLGPAHPTEPFSLIFLDPPYGKCLAERALESVRDGGWLAPDALIVVEEAAEAGFAPPPGFEEIERRAYGDTQLIFLRAITPR